MRSLASSVELTDLGPEFDSFKEEVLDGLARRPKQLPSKYFYDARGSVLFDQICELEEYYPTRTELAIMQSNIDEIVDCLGPRCLLVEYGSGSSLKTRELIDQMIDPVAYVPIDISREHLADSAASLSAAFPELEVLPVCADYTGAISLPSTERPYDRVIVYFPGSTIGNFEPAEAQEFLERMTQVGEALLIGVDLQKDKSILEAAYNDAKGVTAAFNKNLLRRMNRELGATFDLSAFDHQAVYNGEHGRIEMYLISRRNQCVRIAGRSVHFERGERICTEYSYKYTLDGFARLASTAGFRVERVWTDAEQHFSLQYCGVK